MGKQIYFMEINERATSALFEFFQSNDLVVLFCSLYTKVKRNLSKIIIRGIPNEIFGVSHIHELSIFYVERIGIDSFTIHFRGLSDELSFSTSNSETLEYYTEKMINLRLHNADKFRFANYETVQYPSTAPHEKNDPPTDEIEINPVHKKSDIKKTLDEQEKSSELDSNISNYSEVDPDELPFFEQFGIDPTIYSETFITHEIFQENMVNRLKRAGIFTLEDLLEFSPNQLLHHTTNIGKKSLEEIKKQLKLLYLNTSKQNSKTQNDAPSQIPSMALETERNRFHDWLLGIKDITRAVVISSDPCRNFMEKLQDWSIEYVRLKGIWKRDQEIFIRRVVKGETLESIGADYKISRERVRQIEKRVKTKININSSKIYTKFLTDKFQQLISLFQSINENEVYVYLNYVVHQNKSLAHFILSFFFAEDEINNLIKDIIRSPIAGKPHKEPKSERPSYIPPIPTGRQCPRCGSELVIYTTRRGKNPGTKFIGCSMFPHCWHKEFLTEEDLSLVFSSIDITENNYPEHTENKLLNERP